ncbi:hypothetical protein [Streptomyces sp. wa22]|uniref:hypothetical protein n=1 Tax=Streptomyces sp. wa22 TaxID=1828244 RepID=UPI0011C8AD9D|nr:hypothetical protein [Streptomyces sp. wa22]
MNLAEHLGTGAVAVASGVTIELVMRCLRRWRTPTKPPEASPPALATTEEVPPMGRPGHITKPDLPPGAHRELVDLLHDLHVRSGRMSMRTIGELTRRPHTTVHKALSSPELPDLHVVMAIGLVLANVVRSSDQDALLDDVQERIETLWKKAAHEGRPPAVGTILEVVTETWAEFSRGEGMASWGINLPDYSQLARCPFLSVTLRNGLVTLVVSTPDWAAINAVEDPQQWHRLFECAVIKKLDYFLHVWVEHVPGFDTIANPCPPPSYFANLRAERGVP